MHELQESLLNKFYVVTTDNSHDSEANRFSFRKDEIVLLTAISDRQIYKHDQNEYKYFEYTFVVASSCSEQKIKLFTSWHDNIRDQVKDDIKYIRRYFKEFI